MKVRPPTTRALIVIALITIANLRGLRESGNIFAVPTYLFVGLALTIVAIGAWHIATGEAHPLPRQPEAVTLGTDALSVVLLLKAFASGSVALTGVEAIANGVPAFKPPEARNAANTLLAMALLLGVIFIGVTIVARSYDIVPSRDLSGGPTVIALVAQTAFGTGPVYYVFQVATALILFLAANTSFNAFPRLAAILADLASSNMLLVPLDRRGQWYRYHHLFRDMLLAELERMEPGRNQQQREHDDQNTLQAFVHRRS